MLKYNRILCPTDFSEPSIVALNQSVAIAQQFGSEILVLHVVPPMPPFSSDLLLGSTVEPDFEASVLEDAKARVASLLEDQVPTGVRAQAIVACGDPADEIVRVSQDHAIDLIVISTHGETGWRHLIFGSVAEKVVRVTPCPVLTLNSGHAVAKAA